VGVGTGTGAVGVTERGTMWQWGGGQEAGWREYRLRVLRSKQTEGKRGEVPITKAGGGRGGIKSGG
jgi:hypothetical protein